jgi:hypothetical protein
VYNIEMDFKETGVVVCGLDLTGTGYESVLSAVNKVMSFRFRRCGESFFVTYKRINNRWEETVNSYFRKTGRELEPTG